MLLVNFKEKERNVTWGKTLFRFSGSFAVLPSCHTMYFRPSPFSYRFIYKYYSPTHPFYSSWNKNVHHKRANTRWITGYVWVWKVFRMLIIDLVTSERKNNIPTTIFKLYVGTYILIIGPSKNFCLDNYTHVWSLCTAFLYQRKRKAH